MAGIGFVNAVIRTVIAGRVTEDPPVITYVKPDTPENLAAVPLVTGSTFVAAYCDPASSNDEFPVVGYRWYVNDVPVRDTSDPEFVRLGLTPSTAYRIRVAAFTVGAVSDLSDEIVITTDASGGVEPEVDTTPPSAPVLTSVTADTPNAATAVWTASTDNVGVAYYIMQIDGQDATAAYSPTLTASWGAFSQGRAYDITIVAVDGAGNRSAKSNVVRVNMPGAIVQPPAPRTLAGTAPLRNDLSDGLISYVGPAPAARSLDGATTLAGATASGSVTNVTAVTASPTWVTPATDTTYSYDEGDTVNIPLAATDYTGSPAQLSAYSLNLPANVVLDTANRRLYGVLAAGTGSQAGRDYDNYVLASDAAVSPPSITTTSLPTGQAGQAYSTIIGTTGGVGSRYLAIVGGAPTPTPTDGWTINPTTGELTCNPTEQYSGTIQISVTDSASQVSYKTFNLYVSPVVVGDDFATRAVTAGTLYATNFKDVYLGDGTNPAVLTPARQINTTAQLNSNHIGNTHKQADGVTPRAVLDTTTFPGRHALHLPGLATDDRQGGDWQQHINGVAAATYRRIYAQFVIHFDREAIVTRWDGDYDHKLFQLGSTLANGEFVFTSRANNGSISVYWDGGAYGIGNVPGARIPANQQPWSRDVYRIYNAFDRGATDLTNTNSEPEKVKWLNNYGPLRDGFDRDPDGNYGYIADLKYHDERGALMTRGYPDAEAFRYAPGLRYGRDHTVQIFAEHVPGVDFLSLMFWLQIESEPPFLLFKSIGNLPISSGSGDTYWRGMTCLEYSTDRIAGTALDRNTWYKEVQTSLKPIPMRGGFMPPGNLG